MERDRECQVEMAKMAEQAERYPDMAKEMKALVEQHPELTNEERNLLSVAYKNEVGARRSAWRVICSIESKSDVSAETRKCAAEYKVTIAKELEEICSQVLVRMIYLLEDCLWKQKDFDQFFLDLKWSYSKVPKQKEFKVLS